MIREHIEKCAGDMGLSLEEYLHWCSRKIGADYEIRLRELLQKEEQEGTNGKR